MKEELIQLVVLNYVCALHNNWLIVININNRNNRYNRNNRNNRYKN